MTNKQAYDRLLDERPVIVKVLQRDADKFPAAEWLADKIINRYDPDELRALILQAAKHIKGQS